MPTTSSSSSSSLDLSSSPSPKRRTQGGANFGAYSFARDEKEAREEGRKGGVSFFPFLLRDVAVIVFFRLRLQKKTVARCPCLSCLLCCPAERCSFLTLPSFFLFFSSASDDDFEQKKSGRATMGVELTASVIFPSWVYLGWIASSSLCEPYANDSSFWA